MCEAVDQGVLMSESQRGLHRKSGHLSRDSPHQEEKGRGVRGSNMVPRSPKVVGTGLPGGVEKGDKGPRGTSQLGQIGQAYSLL